MIIKKAAIAITEIPMTKNNLLSDFKISLGERLKVFALACKELAKQSAPTLSARIYALPLATNVPEYTSLPTPLNTLTDSPVINDSLTPTSPCKTIPSTPIWASFSIKTMSSRTISSTSITTC